MHEGIAEMHKMVVEMYKAGQELKRIEKIIDSGKNLSSRQKFELETKYNKSVEIIVAGKSVGAEIAKRLELIGADMSIMTEEEMKIYERVKKSIEGAI